MTDQPVRAANTGPTQPFDQPDDWEAVREQVIGYLKAGRGIAAARGRGVDEVDPERGRVVPLMVMTDGTFTWTAASSYYAEEHDLAPHPDLIELMREQGFVAPEVSDEDARRVSQASHPGA